jgi:tetratricopeptide (TPR) repeat protein
MSRASVVAATLALIAALAAGLTARQHRIARLEAHESLDRLTSKAKVATYLLGVPNSQSPRIEEGIALCRKAVDRYEARTDRRWLTNRLASPLTGADQSRLRQSVGELLTVWARALLWKAEASTNRRAEWIAEAEGLVAAANACYGTGLSPRALRLLSAELIRLAGRAAEADQLCLKAETIPLRTTHDRLLLVSNDLNHGRNREALALAEEASRLDPGDFSAWLLRGHCLARMAQNELAEQCFGIGIDLQPGLLWAYFDRGLISLKLRNYDRALADFDRFIGGGADQSEGLRNRALAKLGRGDAPGAIAGLDRLLNSTDAPTSALFIRSRAHKLRGNLVAADADLREGVARIPNDEQSWIARGQSRMPVDPAGALEAFRSASLLNSKSLEAFQNEARVLSETLGQTAEAIKALNHALENHPQSESALAARSVLMARLGRRDEALNDARACLALDDSADTLYKAACTFALTCKRAPADAAEALRLLALAARKDASILSKFDSESDFAALRDRPDCRKLRDALAIVCPPVTSPN